MLVRFLGQEDPLEEEMATHSRILAWGIPRTEEPGGPRSMGSQESDTTEHARRRLQAGEAVLTPPWSLSCPRGHHQPQTHL